ncbi:MAG: BREX-1 system adenine-specific DNA-methyltransferase PglX [Prevotella sp.]|jgi:REP element-mobilizing transposase RayT|nr:BREX-1 system adenine-specific DNA-methyltransferase PglX [Prevotella sp.]MCI1324268.1 BREX-1 system adenine-specific DNA-methyltransferase PglX [Prevotella sp.]MCI1349326.1 BREX-1 system adenine-specific DNA-methyltransferase PglX [Prevotella sp.]MCI1415935.1 BREX-1 system adenine-specific DNA-methyltransferase PglX [Prevotella sp.]
MDTNGLKRFAAEARTILIQGVRNRVEGLGFDLESGQPAALPQLKGGGAVFMDETQSEAFYDRWMSLYNHIRNRGVKDVVEEAAYTWFNRLVAIRIMSQLHFITPVLKYESNEIHIPVIVSEARHGRLPEMQEKLRDELRELLIDDAKTNEQFAILIVAFCRSCPVIHQCFGAISDYTELLLPQDILREGGFVDRLNHTDFIKEEDYQSPELIGWLYQFYISERKDEVFAKKGKYEPDEIAPATQIFTPNWIVKYMVQNTVGRMYLDNHPYEKEVAKNWKYLVDIPQRDDKDIYHFTDLDELRLGDLACGSGHILNEFFNLLYQLYTYEGFGRRQTIENIFRENLIGIDLDTRARQLATFSLLMNACQKDDSFLDARVMPRVYDMPRPFCEEFDPEYDPDLQDEKTFIKEQIRPLVPSQDQEVCDELVDAIIVMDHADTLGSIMQFDLSERTRNILQAQLQETEGQCFSTDKARKILPYVRIILALTEKYSALVMNPPYMGSGNMNATLSDYVKRHYKEGKADLFSVFMLLAVRRLAPNGKYGMINMQSWMFLSSFEQLRKDLLETMQIDSMLHLGPHTFDELSGEVVQNTAFVVGGDASRVTNSNVVSRVTEPCVASRVGNHRKENCDARRVVSYLNKKEYVSIGYGKLPHWYQSGKTQFITFRLDDSLPQTKLQELSDFKAQWIKDNPEPWTQPIQEKYNHEIRKKIDKWLDQGMGSCILAKKEIRKIVEDALLHYDGVNYALYAYVIMPNHVHLLLTPLVDEEPNKMVGSVKSFTAHAINKTLGQYGNVWQREVFDRIVRDEDNFEQYVNYIDNNPKNLSAAMFSLGGDASCVANANTDVDSDTLCDARRVASYYRLVEGKNCADKERMFLENRDGNINGAKVYYPNVKQKDFEKIPGCQLGYWLKESVIDLFTNCPKIENFICSSVGIRTGKDNIFIREWFEVSKKETLFTGKTSADLSKSSWFPITRGGEKRKWYGNLENVVFGANNFEKVKTICPDYRLREEKYYFNEGVTWTMICSGHPSFRLCPQGVLFGNGGPTLYSSKQLMLMGLLNTKVSYMFLYILNPTINFTKSDVGLIPFIKNENACDYVTQNITLSKLDWDAHETSWDFSENPLVAIMKQAEGEESIVSAEETNGFKQRNQWFQTEKLMVSRQETDGLAAENNCGQAETGDDHGVVTPLPNRGNDVTKLWYDDYHAAVTALRKMNDEMATQDSSAATDKLIKTTRDASTPTGTLKLCVNAFEKLWTARFMQLHANEEELNRQFIEIYGLQDELTPDVPLDEITILQQGEISIEENHLVWHPDVVMKQLISYIVGVWMGRYRLDRSGLYIAYPNPSAEELAPYTYHGQTVTIDDDAIIPLLPRDSPFEDNLVNRIVDFVRIVFGADMLTENLNFIEKQLGMSIEQYVLKNFWKDHKKMYHNRPIYWLFSSRKGAFQCLVYMHRMDAYTAERVRSKYLLPYMDWLLNRLHELEENAANLSTVERREMDRITRQIAECREYHDRLHVVADRQEGFDLDDGVVVNYAKFGDVLAKLK